MAGYEAPQPGIDGSLALNYSVPRDVISRQWTGEPVENIESTAFMPPFTVHTCCDPQVGSAHGNFIVSHSVPPFYVPIPTLTANGKENMTATPPHSPSIIIPIPKRRLDPEKIKRKAIHLSSSAINLVRSCKPRWHETYTHRLKNVGWAGAWLLVLFLLFLVYGILPNRWYHVLYMTSGSMSPAINPGDLIIITPPTRILEPGMVLTMRVDGQLVTHRLLGISSGGMLLTKGDANNTLDNWDQSKLEIGGIVRGRIPYLGYLSQVAGIFNQAAAGGWFADAHEIKMDITSGTWVFEPTATPPGQSGTSITASVTVEGVCVPSTMTVSEGVAPDLKKCEDLPPGDPGATDEMQEMNAYGQICLSNTGEVPTRDLKVLFQVGIKPKGGSSGEISDTGFDFVPAEPLAAGASRCYSYRAGFQPVEGLDEYKLSAHVTITNHSGWMLGGPHCTGPDPCPFGPEPKAGFSLEDFCLACLDQINVTGEEILLLQTPRLTDTSVPTVETPIPTEISATPVPTEIIAAPTDAPPIYIITEESPPPLPTDVPPVFVPTDEPPVPTDASQ